MRRSIHYLLLQYLQARQNDDAAAGTSSQGDDDGDEEEEEENYGQSHGVSNGIEPTRINNREREQHLTEYRRQIEERRMKLEATDIAHTIRRDCNLKDVLNSAEERSKRRVTHSSHIAYNMLGQLNERRVRHDKLTRTEKIGITQKMIPNFSNGSSNLFQHRLFCGQFSNDGSIFMSACQDAMVRLYHYDHLLYARSKKVQATPFKIISARDVHWSIIDVDYSPNCKFVAYSSWSPFVHLAAVDTMSDYHEGLNLEPESSRFCAFSIRFSPDSCYILAGASDSCLYLYDLERRQRIMRVVGHDNDINTICFADSSGNIFYSGSDDSYCKVWDKRILSETHSAPIGVMVGHAEGITCIASKNDARHVVSNSKDQSMKLWDIRALGSYPANQLPRITHNDDMIDYRYQIVPSRYTRKISKHDTSLMTYTGHRILQTLIRCRFSPMNTTGQRYLYTGSSDGAVYIYDILSGNVVEKLVAHSDIVRDVSWHPFSADLLSSSWDGSFIHWSYKENEQDQEEDENEDKISQMISDEYETNAEESISYAVMEDDDINDEDYMEDENYQSETSNDTYEPED
jgi:WD repeat-containing protein 23